MHHIEHQLNELGIKNWRSLYSNQKAPELIEMAVQRQEGILASNGALVVYTGDRTGRSPVYCSRTR